MTSNPHGRSVAPRYRDRAVAVLSFLVALACDPFGSHYSFKDEGRICLYPGGSPAAEAFALQTNPLSYEGNRALDIVITMPRCLSGSCSFDRKAECTAAAEGGIIRVQSSASYREQGTACTDDCVALAAKCSTAALPPGAYQVQHGDTTLALTVPSTIKRPCGGNGLGAP
jgi:hypothetical protein